MTWTKRQTSAPCNVCSKRLEDNQTVIFCPECGEPYHDYCWNKIGKKCRIRGCRGRKYHTWPLFEKKILQKLNVERSKLHNKCTNCSTDISPLARYCSICGFDINRIEKQKTFKAYPLIKWLQNFHRPIYAILLVTSTVFLYFSGVFLFGIAQNIGTTITELMEESPTLTLVPSKIPTQTNTIVPTINPTSTPLRFTVTPRLSTPTKTPSSTRRPTNTPSSTNSPTKLVSQNLSSCSEISSISVSDTSKGDVLKIKCTNGSSYEMSPLAKGAYAIGPNKKFFVYCTNDGYVYAARVGVKYVTQIGNFKAFQAVKLNVIPNLEITYKEGRQQLFVVVHDRRYVQREDFEIPSIIYR